MSNNLSEVVASCMKSVLTCEEQLLKHLAIYDNVYLEAMTTGKEQVRGAYVIGPPAAEQLNTPQLVSQYVKAAETATAALHKQIASLPLCVPFEASLAYERLDRENTDLTAKILDAAKNL